MTRSRVRPIDNSACSISAIATAVALGWAAFFATSAAAQENTTLRGAIATEENGMAPLPSTRPRFAERSTELPQATSAPRYRPVSEGALPDEAPEAELDGYVEPGAIATNDLTAARTVRRRSTADRADTGQEEQSPAARSQTAGERLVGEEQADDTTLTTGTVRTGSAIAGDEERNTAARVSSERVGAIEAIPAEQQDDPYAAPGIRIGSFLLRPTLSQGIEWTSNNQSTAGGSSDFLSSTNLNIEAASQWSRHSATLSLDGTYRTSITGTGFSEFTGSADAAGVVDVGNDYRVNAGAGYSRGPEAATSPTVLSGTAGRALRQTLTGTLGVEKHAGKLRASLTGEVARNTYGNATLSGGGTLSQADRNNTLYSATLRGGYEISPALVPFIELEYGRRNYDQRLDSGGFARSANIFGARGGVEFDLGEKLNGEVSAGWLGETIDDSRLASISALSVDAQINWSPMRGTIVALNAGTEVEGSTNPASSGSVLYDASVSLTRQMRANLTGTATLGAGWRRYAASADRDLTLNGELSLTWWLNRFAGVTGRASHERVSSNVAGRGSQTSTVFLGLTLRR
ncbi:outer membrane beta-barrel protein [Mesorhizobium sp. Z1-4]|uniref:outer membrane beta-barrel protein n=1 Tax=Mesorhizobium sp. Z1-4 TaxID=2448478 RepID=UPI000FDAAB2D|nr:outer membrane beta-barrel protein [Mesorhizobium sp. Z1-4]